MHQHEPGGARADEGQPDRPARAQRPGHEQDPVPPEPRDERRRQPRADQPADAGRGEGEAVLPGREPELAEHEHGEQRRGGHDQAVDQDGVEEQRAQRGVGEDVPPAVEQVAGPQPRAPARAGRGSLPADRADARAPRAGS